MKKFEEGKCPKCGKELSYHEGGPADGGFFYEVDCSCGFEGQEWYELSFSGFVIYPGEEIEGRA